MSRSRAFPVKTREFHNHHFDSTIWNDLVFGDDDIVIATYAKSGTTWMQRRIAEFLEIDVPGDRWAPIMEYCSFDWMKRHATKSVPLGGAFWDAGAQVFVNKDINGRWRDTLTSEEVAEYEIRAESELGADCARWLMTGDYPD